LDDDDLRWRDQPARHRGALDAGRPDAWRGVRSLCRTVPRPVLRPGDVVITDNLSSHKSERARRAIERRGAKLLFLPPYSPDFNPIEMAFAKVKALLCKAAARTYEALLDAVRNAIDTIAPAEAANFFTAAGYEPD
jgi:transposase InsO family protein